MHSHHNRGKWNQFTGDQIGIMLGAWIFQQYKTPGRDVCEFH